MGLSQTRPIPRSPDGDKNSRIPKKAYDNDIKLPKKILPHVQNEGVVGWGEGEAFCIMLKNCRVGTLRHPLQWWHQEKLLQALK